MNSFRVDLAEGFKIIVEQNTGDYDKEIFIGVENPSGSYIQDLAIVRPVHTSVEGKIVYSSEEFEVLVYGDAEDDNYTEKFGIRRRKEDEE